jgi:hypothetical protein
VGPIPACVTVLKGREKFSVHSLACCEKRSDNEGIAKRTESLTNPAKWRGKIGGTEVRAKRVRGLLTFWHRSFTFKF